MFDFFTHENHYYKQDETHNLENGSLSYTHSYSVLLILSIQINTAYKEMQKFCFLFNLFNLLTQLFT